MSKRKPDQTITHRIELQTKERELLETYILVDGLKEIAPSLIAVAGATGGSYMIAAWLHMAFPSIFPPPPLLPNSDENSQQNAFVTYAVDLAKRRTDSGVGGFLNPLTFWTDVIQAFQTATD